MDEEWIERIRKSIPELPEQKRGRFVAEHDIPEYDAGVLTASQSMANYYEECVALHPHPKIISNWIMGDLSRELKNDDREIEDCPVTPGSLIGLLQLIDKGTINGKMAKTVFEDMYQTGKPAEVIVKQKGMVQISDSSAIDKLIDEVLANSPKQLESYRNGKETIIGYFVGQIMKASKGQANPAVVNQLLKDKLSQ